MSSQSAKIEVIERFADKWWRLNNLYWIIDADGHQVRFQCNPLQEKLFDDLWYLNMLLKARQFGGTTFTDIYFLDDCLFIDNLEAGIIAHNREDAQKIFRRKVKFPYDHLPEGLKNQRYLTTDSRQELAFSNGSTIYVATSVRSGTVQRLHICLTGDMEILTKNGVIKEIKDIKPGELVLTSRGSYQRVEQVVRNRLSDLGDSLLAIHTFGYYKPLKLTTNHKVLTRQHKTGHPVWKRACELLPGDYIACPIREPSLKSRDGLIPFGWSRVIKIEKIPDEKYVYDLALSNSPHDYVTVNGVVHNSEHARICRKYPEKAEEIKAGSLNAIQPGNIVVIESTAQGRHGDFFDFCQAARKLQQAGKKLTKMDYKFHFFPWFWDPKNTMEKKEALRVPISQEMAEYFARIESIEKTIDVKPLKLTRGQKAWYVKKYESLGEDLMKQEFPSTPDEAFEASIKGAYYSVQMTGLRKRKQITTVPYEPSLPVNTAWDLGVDDEAVIVFHQRHRLENRIIDYYANNDNALSHYVGILRQKGYVYGTHYLPHDIKVKSLSTGKSRLETLRKLMPGEKIRVVEKLDLADGIEAVRNFLPTCWIDETKCAPLIDALDAYQREPDDKHGGFKDKPLHNWASDPADAMRYLAIGFNPETKTGGGWKRRKRTAMVV